MTRTLTTLLLALFLSGIIAMGGSPKRVSQGRIEALVSNLQSEAAHGPSNDDDSRVVLPGLKVVSKGGLDLVSVRGFWVKTALRFADDGDNDMKEAMGLMKSLRKLMVVSYEDCGAKLREKYGNRISKALEGCELLMEARDGDESVSIYGVTSKDGSKVEDIVLFCPESCSLICFFGSLDTEKFGEFVAKASKNQ